MAKTIPLVQLAPVLKSPFLKSHRVQAYCIIVLVCSIIPFSETYKIHKHHVLNQWFVKLGWFWTLVALLPMQFITTKPCDKEAVFHSLILTISSSTLWYLSVNLFEFVDSYTGFDISGHTFLLAFSNLLLSSELSLFKHHLKSIKLEQEVSTAKHLSTIKTFTTLLMVLWDLMLLQTALYYHTLPQKIIAVLWAIGSWTILYKLHYQDRLSEAKQVTL